MRFFRAHGLAALLAFVPLAAAVDHFAPTRSATVFALSAVAILPLAAYIGRATEALAARLGGAIGGLLNATFGNAAELIIGALALRHGLDDLVKASITGSIIGNVLLVFGMSAIVGGRTRKILCFNRTAASSATTMLLMSAVALVVPAVFRSLSRSTGGLQRELDTEIAIVLLLTYGCYLLFTLKTHRQVLAAGTRHEAATPQRSVASAMLMLLGATAGTAYTSELLVNTVSATARSFGMSHLFVGVVIVALVGNAAEHYSAVAMAAEDRMDATLSIAVGSSTQVALFVAPVLVLLSYWIAPQPLDLLFTVFEVVAIVMSVVVIAFIAHDGETHWMEGVQLLAVYVILAIGFYLLPVSTLAPP